MQTSRSGAVLGGGQRETSLEEFTHEVECWLPFLREVALPRLTGEMLASAGYLV